MVKVLVSGSTSPGLSPDQERCVAFLGKTLNSCSASLHPVPLSNQVYKWVPVNLMLGVTHSGRSRNTPSCFVPYKPDLSARLMGNLA